MKLFIFNGKYGVIATTKDDAKKKLSPWLPSEHRWYLDPSAECQSKQGHLEVTEIEIKYDVIIFPDKINL